MSREAGLLCRLRTSSCSPLTCSILDRRRRWRKKVQILTLGMQEKAPSSSWVGCMGSLGSCSPFSFDFFFWDGYRVPSVSLNAEQ